MQEVANKRIPVTPEVWESLSKLKRPGQTYDSLLEEMIALKEEHDFLMQLEELERTGDFVSLSEAERELEIKKGKEKSGRQ
jgi:predicted CopG family antitoxin